MAEFLVSASTGAMSSLLHKLGTMLTDEYKMLKDMRGDIKFLKDELEAMNAYLLRMSDVEEPDGQAKLRVRAVRELSYDIEDNIDKFMVLVDRESNSNAHGVKKLIDMSKNKLAEIKTRHQIAKEVKDIKKKITEVSERYSRYQIDEGTSKPRSGTVDPRVRTIYKDVSELVGINGPTEKLVELLMGGEHELVKQLKVVSIVGFGGLGKTTLANQVYHKLGAKFECRAFVSISRNPDMMKIFRSILSQIRHMDYAHTEAGDEQQLIGKIVEFLENKRYLIVVDDIWHVSTWKIMECAFPKNRCGSRIITTSRKNDVAQSCCSSDSDLIYTIEPLSPIDSKRLFLKIIFGSEKRCPSNLEEVSNEILKKCGGLPLAIIVVSSFLATKNTTDQWDRVRRSIGHAIGDNSDSEGMTKILSLSYFDLPHYLRTCLLCVAIFPEDYKIGKYELVCRWIAEGFIHCQPQDNLLKLGETYFNELINRSLIQPAHLRHDGRVTSCRVHDTILDFLTSKSTEQNFASMINNPKLTNFPMADMKVRRLSLAQNEKRASHIIIPPNWNIYQIRSLTIFGGVKHMLPFSNFRVLRVLDMQNCTGLENHHLVNIGKLCQLRYLKIRGEKITELPSEIGDLQYLEMLNVQGLSLKELPRTIVRLQRLKQLFVDCQAKLPDRIGKMRNLEELARIDVFSYTTGFIEELGELTNLRFLCIDWDIDKVKGDKGCYKDTLTSSLRILDACNLDRLGIDVHLRNGDDFSADSSFSALKSLQDLGITGENICKVTKWFSSFVNLERLFLAVEEIPEHDDLGAIGNIPTLHYLGLRLNTGPKDRFFTIRCNQGFQGLERFFFHSVHTCLMFEAGSMPKLKILSLYIQPVEFKSAIGCFDFGMQHLCCLTKVRVIIDSQGASVAEVEAAEDAFKTIVEAHPNRPTLEIEAEQNYHQYFG